MTLQDIIKERIVILDGAMGTEIQGFRLGERDFRGERFREVSGMMSGNNDMLNLTRPGVIREIHRRYLEAGADLITTNTFSSQRISQADYHLEDYAYEMAFEGARIARSMADEFSTEEHPRFVCGSVGPTNKTCSMSSDVSNPAARDLTYDQLYQAYHEQIVAMIEGGIDILLIETIFDTLNAKVAIDAAESVMAAKGKKIPVMLSVTVSDLAGRTLSGQTLQAFLASISSYDIFSVGLNCSFGAAQMKPFLKELAQHAPYYISAYPNAGLPNELGQYDESAESMSPQIQEFIDERLVNILGGCCGTTAEFISRYVEMAKGKPVHQPIPKPEYLLLSGLEPLCVTTEVHFVNVGERCNVAGSRKFLRLIKEKQYEEAMTIARKQVEDGALVIDINMDDGLLDAKAEMVHFLNMIAAEPEIARVPVMLDSSQWDVIVAGLKSVQGKCIVNSISLKEGEDVLAIATGMEEHDNYAVDFIKATGWIRRNLPGAHVSGGVSNLSFSLRGNNYIREAMHAVFLYHAIQQGMDFGIVNPATKVTYNDIPSDQLEIIEDVVLNRRQEASEALIELANQIKAEAEANKTIAVQANETLKKESSENRSAIPVEDRLSQALIKGVGDHLEEDLHEALQKYPHAVNIIEGPLMSGMNTVGKLFGEGKMFLPQVVKTARTMKQAVTILQPYMEADKKEGSARKAGKILLATVKGDVHDIGKNIVSVVMACNNYEVIDMGVMVPAEQIVRKAQEENVDLIGLSGLITPSLEEMVNVANELKRAGLHIPIMIGGATTSQLHVALKIAPVYGGPVVWMKDASQNALVAAKLMNEKEEKQLARELNDQYEQMRVEYNEEQEKLLTLDEARKNKLDLFSE